MADSAALSKAAAKNKKRAEKRRKERIQKVKENGGRVLEAMEMKDPVSILREQLQEAKNNQNHGLAARLRQQLWIAQDSAAGVSMAEVEDLGGDISSLKDDVAVINKTKTTSTNPPASADLPASGLTPAEKRLRALKKKLQQIENLKEKIEHGETLEKTQLDKISKEQELLEEIQEIESLLTGSAPLI